MHKYLGLTVDYSKKNQVMFTMYDYIEDVIGTIFLDVNHTVPDSAKAGLFTVSELSLLLNKKAAVFFRSMTVRLLIAAKRARPDIQVDVAYLYTRV